MANPQRLPKNLRDALGTPASEDLGVILDEIRAESRASERRLMAHMDGMEARLSVRIDNLATRVHAVEAGLVDLRVKLAESKADLMKWSFVFWVGAVTAVAVLAGVLR